MSYVVRTTPRFEKEFKKLDRYTMKMIKAWIEKNLSGCENPRVREKLSRQIAKVNGGIVSEITDCSAL